MIIIFITIVIIISHILYFLHILTLPSSQNAVRHGKSMVREIHLLAGLRRENYNALYCTIRYYTILHYTTLHYTILYYTILYYTILY